MQAAAFNNATVIALHCSGASGEMWRPLRAQLAGEAVVLTPGFYGVVDGPAWPGERAFCLDDDVALIIQAIDEAAGPVFLVGHSYGATVALQVALARTDRIAGLTLFEPAAFQMLRLPDGVEYAEIAGLARDVEVMLARGDARGAMKRFITYWGGAGAWERLSHDAQLALMRWSPKAPLDFRALLSQPAHTSRYELLEMPCRIISGTRSPEPVREIARILCDVMPDCDLTTLDDVGHLGPITHWDLVAAEIAEHIRLLRRKKIRQGHGRAA